MGDLIWQPSKFELVSRETKWSCSKDVGPDFGFFLSSVFVVRYVLIFMCVIGSLIGLKSSKYINPPLGSFS